MSAYFPYAGTLSHVVQPYRKIPVTAFGQVTLPPNTTSFLCTVGFVLVLPDGSSVDYSISGPPTQPISIEAIYPKGDFVVQTLGVGTLSVYAHP